ncbi:DUF2490 domain-containing protein [Flavivirga eckloniae]|uniref:DUF2490 domain-containing protein n=1 Tax=Flavivirga eckloniae TaxID=1803846 RepID=A0A2K9PSE2_9FLAO|nr:DUF2490 domain-containing protein [Flavivirga eckloniae]AUP79993.1 hypothetical protein C1H87_15300 [Flavivirga eckloniae]
MQSLFKTCIFLLLLFVNDVQSQEEPTINSQLWINYYPSFYLKEKIQVTGEVGYRTILEDDSYRLLYIRPSINYLYDETFEINGGLGMWYEFNKNSSDRFEIRPWQGIRINWPNLKKLNLNRWQVNQWFRVEERFSFFTQDNWKTSLDVRARYKLSGKLDLCIDCINPKFAIPFYMELFLSLSNISEIYNNQGRFGVGLDYFYKKNLQFEFLFHWQSSKIEQEDPLSVSDYIFQLKIKHKLNHNPFRKKKK